MSLCRNKQEMYLKIQNVIKAIDLQKPKTVTYPDKPDILIEKDLQGFDLNDLKDKKTVKLLSSDIAIFNDYAFRYYTLQFMGQYFLSRDYIFLTLFVPPYNKIENNSNRFLQFGQKEVEAIIYFFQYLHDEIEFLKDKFKNIDFNDKSSAPNTEDNLTMHYLDLLDNEHDIGGALVFWKSHPTINVKLGFYGAKSGVIKP